MISIHSDDNLLTQLRVVARTSRRGRAGSGVGRHHGRSLNPL